MKEKNLSQRILKNSNIVKWSRVESKTSPGIPDLHGFFKDINDLQGYTFWLELKLTKHNKVALTSKQIAWHYHYYKNGGTSFICVKTLLQRGARIYTGQRGSELAKLGAKLEPDMIIDEPWNENQLIEFVKYFKNTPSPRQAYRLP